jgi:hypothetical protein
MRIFRSRAAAPDLGESAQPAADAGAVVVAEPSVVVAVVGSPSLVALLSNLLPDGWVARDFRPDTIGAAELVVLAGATGSAVAAARAAAPDAGIVGVVDPVAPTAVIVDVLEAGADACVRCGDAWVIAGHIAACRRRRLEASARAS